MLLTWLRLAGGKRPPPPTPSPAPSTSSDGSRKGPQSRPRWAWESHSASWGLGVLIHEVGRTMARRPSSQSNQEHLPSARCVAGRGDPAQTTLPLSQEGQGHWRRRRWTQDLTRLLRAQKGGTRGCADVGDTGTCGRGGHPAGERQGQAHRLGFLNSSPVQQITEGADPVQRKSFLGDSNAAPARRGAYG